MLRLRSFINSFEKNTLKRNPYTRRKRPTRQTPEVVHGAPSTAESFSRHRLAVGSGRVARNHGHFGKLTVLFPDRPVILPPSSEPRSNVRPLERVGADDVSSWG